jgi:TPP-dependent pyruvate/acetoin dehydrogenase alpha subunit
MALPDEVNMPRKVEKVTPIRTREREAPADLLVDLYKKMLNVYYLEERIKTFVRAGKVSFHASSRGHEKVQIAMSYLLEPGKDWFFPSRTSSSTCSRRRTILRAAGAT